MTKTLLTLLSILCAGLPAHAWNAVGHRAVAELAWRRMTPAQRDAASELLKHHPHYTNILADEVPAGVDTNHWAFLTGAVWLDLIRPAKPGQPPKPESITKYNIYPHGIGLPFLPPGETDRELLKNVSPPNPDARVVLADAIKTFNDHHASSPERAISLCVILHLIGDLHQPLHIATLVTKDKPGGYELGGKCLVRDPEGNEVNLHIFWDHLPGQDYSYAGVASLADNIADNPSLQPGALPEYELHKTIAAWVQEGYQVARDFAYAPDRVRFADSQKVHSGKTKTIPGITPEYARDAKQVAHRRLALAALRLWPVLDRAW